MGKDDSPLYDVCTCLHSGEKRLLTLLAFFCYVNVSLRVTHFTHHPNITTCHVGRRGINAGAPWVSTEAATFLTIPSSMPFFHAPCKTVMSRSCEIRSARTTAKGELTAESGSRRRRKQSKVCKRPLSGLLHPRYLKCVRQQSVNEGSAATDQKRHQHPLLEGFNNCRALLCKICVVDIKNLHGATFSSQKIHRNQ